MQEIKYIYNDEKENAVFAVKLRGLFENRKKTHRELAEYIEKVTGESVTRQAVGQWCNGNTCPNLKTVPIIAKFFDVSCDYLLTETEIKTTNADLTAACKYTGLSQRAVIKLAEDFVVDPEIEPIKDLTKGWAEAASRIIEEGFLFFFAREMTALANISEYYSNTFFDFEPEEMFNLSKEINVNPALLWELLNERSIKFQENTPVHDEYAVGVGTIGNIREQCDLCRYALIKYAESISNMFDRRKGWKNYTREQLLEYLNITEEELKELQARSEQEANNGKHNEETE